MELRRLRYSVAVAEELHFGHAANRLHTSQNLTPEAQVDALGEGRIDVGFVGLPLDAEGLITEATGRVRLLVALPEKHPMARNDTLKLEELSKEA